MGDSKDTTARVAARARRISKGVYEATPAGASGATIYGRGASAKEATEALAAALAWTAHVDPSIALDAEGGAWLLYPWGPPGSWTVRRVNGPGDGIHAVSRGSTSIEAPNWTKALALIAEWNRPDPAL